MRWWMRRWSGLRRDAEAELEHSSRSGVYFRMRFLLASAVLFLSGCGPGLTFNASTKMTRTEMLDRASLIFVGVIEEQNFPFQPFFRAHVDKDSDTDANWRILRRRVRVDIYEIFWTGGTSGDWNSTRPGERDLFLVRVENGRYHVVRDWWRSIFRVTTGPHTRLPLNESTPLWERIALMNLSIEPSSEILRISKFHHLDPANVLGLWRLVKLERGLVRHPSPGVRVAACRELLLLFGWGQDECWDVLSIDDKAHIRDGGYTCCTPEEVAERRRLDRKSSAAMIWDWHRDDREVRRLLTTYNYQPIRMEICRLYAKEYPGDHDNGCPADQPPPATIVTDRGDVPLLGAWPQ